MPNSPESYDAWRERQSQSRHARQQERDAYLEGLERMRRLEAPIPVPVTQYSEPELRYPLYSTAVGDYHFGGTISNRTVTFDELLGEWSIKPKPVSLNKKIADLRTKIKMHEGQITQINKYIEKAHLEIKDLQEKLDKDEKE